MSVFLSVQMQAVTYMGKIGSTRFFAKSYYERLSVRPKNESIRLHSYTYLRKHIHFFLMPSGVAFILLQIFTSPRCNLSVAIISCSDCTLKIRFPNTGFQIFGLLVTHLLITGFYTKYRVYKGFAVRYSHLAPHIFKLQRNSQLPAF